MKTVSTAIGVLASTLSIGAQAGGSIGYDFRADSNSTSYNEDAALPGYQKFHLKTGRLHFKGDLNEQLKYELRWAYNKPAVDNATTATEPKNTTRDGLNNSIELANITHKMDDMFSLQMGKLNSEIGGLEGATTGADLYMVSPNYAFSAVKGLTGSNVGFNQSSGNLTYVTGVKGDIAINPEHHIYLVYANNATDAVNSGSKFNQNRGLTGLIWKGAYMEKALSAIISYHQVSPQGAATHEGNKHTFTSAGVKYDNPQVVGSFDYTTTDYTDGTTSTKDTLSSMIAKFGYKMDAWTPRLEVYSSEQKVGIGATTGTNKFMGYGAVVEYKPTADNFRYHLAYNTITAKPITGNDQVKTEIVLGARLSGDFLK